MNKRILVVDRSRTLQTLFSIYFRNAGHQVLVCPTAQEALRVLAGLQDVPDMIFLTIDYEKEAYKVIQYTKEHVRYAHTSLVALVLEEEKTGIERALRGSNVRYLVKPIAIQEAVALVSVPLEHA
jgi:DNA-binding response OmpR family regulator